MELLGDAHSVLKHDVLNTVKHIDGVENVIDHINELPPSPMDDRLRRRVAHAIFNLMVSRSSLVGGLQHPHHRVRRPGEAGGIVDTQQDKDTAGVRANASFRRLQVTNDLHVVKNY